jgi:hypothetical protein
VVWISDSLAAAADSFYSSGRRRYFFAGWRFFVVRRKVQSLRQGRDGERAVGQFLERLRQDGGQVFHDIPGTGFNLDHVVISTHGIYAIETKTWSKPWPNAQVVVDGKTLTVAGQVPARSPIVQAASAANWLEKLLRESTGSDSSCVASWFSRDGLWSKQVQGETSGCWSRRCCQDLSGRHRK